MKKYEAINGLNWSSLKEIYVSPRNFLYKFHYPREDETFLSLGRIVHMAILEPDIYEEKCVTRPPEFDSWRTKASKEWKKEQIFEGKEIMTLQEMNIVENIRINFALHPNHDILEFTNHEQIIVWHDKGVKCKGRLDAVSNERVIDLKTTSNLSEFIRRDFFRYLYHGQLGWYVDGAIESGFTSEDSEAFVIACETTPPFDVAIFRLGEEVLTVGKQLKNSLLDRWIACKSANMWPGIYPNLSEIYDVPPWAPGQDTYDDEI